MSLFDKYRTIRYRSTLLLKEIKSNVNCRISRLTLVFWNCSAVTTQLRSAHSSGGTTVWQCSCTADNTGFSRQDTASDRVRRHISAAVRSAVYTTSVDNCKYQNYAAMWELQIMGTSVLNQAVIDRIPVATISLWAELRDVTDSPLTGLQSAFQV